VEQAGRQNDLVGTASAFVHPIASVVELGRTTRERVTPKLASVSSWPAIAVATRPS
jgi:hypothetical protein